MGLEDAYMYECRNGHYFCEGHDVKVDPEKLRAETIKRIKEEADRLESDSSHRPYFKGTERIAHIAKRRADAMLIGGITHRELLDDHRSAEDPGSRYEYTPLGCPICQYKQATNVDALIALKKEYGLNEEEILEIVKKHTDY